MKPEELEILFRPVHTGLTHDVMDSARRLGKGQGAKHGRAGTQVTVRLSGT